MDMTHDNRRVILVDSNQEPYLSQGEIIAKIPVRIENMLMPLKNLQNNWANLTQTWHKNSLVKRIQLYSNGGTLFYV